MDSKFMGELQMTNKHIKDIRSHLSSGKGELKLQWDTISLPSYLEILKSANINWW